MKRGYAAFALLLALMLPLLGLAETGLPPVETRPANTDYRPAFLGRRACAR